MVHVASSHYFPKSYASQEASFPVWPGNFVNYGLSVFTVSMSSVSLQSSCSTMWIVICLVCIFLSRITFAAEKCGLPAKPSHSQLRPDKPFYDHGDNVRVVCEENYVSFGKETGIQTCDYGAWLGKPPVCLKNLVYGLNITHFGAPSGGKAKPHGGVFIYDVIDAREAFFFDFFFRPNESTRHVFVYFRGNFTVTDQRGTELPFEQVVLAFNSNINFYAGCPKSQLGDYFECISYDARYFTGAKIEISLLNKTVDMSKNSLQVKLQIENGGFIVLDVANKDCGTPPVPFRGLVSTVALSTEATYSCERGYTLHGQPVQTCDVAKFPEFKWLSTTPVCLESVLDLFTLPEKDFTSSNLLVVVVASSVGGLVAISMVSVIIWCKNKKAQQQTPPTVPSSVPLINLMTPDNSESAVSHTGYANSSSVPPLKWPPNSPTPVQYPLIVSRNYSPSEYSSRISYQNPLASYGNVQGDHLYATIDSD